MERLILIAGPTASGKSTFRNALRRDPTLIAKIGIDDIHCFTNVSGVHSIPNRHEVQNAIVCVDILGPLKATYKMRREGLSFAEKQALFEFIYRQCPNYQEYLPWEAISACKDVRCITMLCDQATLVAQIVESEIAPKKDVDRSRRPRTWHIFLWKEYENQFGTIARLYDEWVAWVHKMGWKQYLCTRSQSDAGKWTLREWHKRRIPAQPVL